MLLIVAPEKVTPVLSIAERWGLLATEIGEVTDSGRLVVSWRGKTVVDVPPSSLADEGPVYARPMREPNDLPLLHADKAETLRRPKTGDELRDTVLRLAASPNLCDKPGITEQYAGYVLGNTVLAQPEAAGVLRLDEKSGLGIAISPDGNGRYTRLDPYRGAQLALAEAYRNVAVTGALPVAVTNCLNFGSPEDPQVMWQFAEAVRGLADGCQALGIPVTGGNVSFYNQTGAVAINPTPIVGVLGLLDNVAERVPMGLRKGTDVLFLLGETRVELSGSEWAWVTYRHLGGRPPQVDLAREKQLGEVIRAAVKLGVITAAHDLSDGGLAQALVEATLRHGVGAMVQLPEDLDAFVSLFSESAGRALVAVPLGREKAFTALTEEHGLAYTPLGVAGGDSLEGRDPFSIPLTQLRDAWTATPPAPVGPGRPAPHPPEPGPHRPRPHG